MMIPDVSLRSYTVASDVYGLAMVISEVRVGGGVSDGDFSWTNSVSSLRMSDPLAGSANGCHVSQLHS